MIEPLLQAERLLLHGMLEQAEQLFRRVAEQDPRNSIALVGLARVSLERGDEEAALGHARAALDIDPENRAAIRLEARLREVLAERGRQVTEAAAAPGWAAQAEPTDSPPWSSSGPPDPSTASDARPSEQVAFTRNPSMADHRRLERKAEEAAATPREQPIAMPAAQHKRAGLLGRLLGRKGGS